MSNIATRIAEIDILITQLQEEKAKLLGIELETNPYANLKSLSNKANNNKTCVVENSIKEENDIKNYDEIPIKPLNVNFIELVEKSIANDNSLNKDESTIKKNN